MAKDSEKKYSRNKRILLKVWKWGKRIFIWIFIIQLFYIVLLKWINPPITMTQFVSWVSGHGMKRDYVSRKNISPNAKLAVIAAEDQLFPDHDGFDWRSIKKAMAYNKKKPGRIRGGSTMVAFAHATDNAVGEAMTMAWQNLARQAKNESSIRRAKAARTRK